MNRDCFLFGFWIIGSDLGSETLFQFLPISDSSSKFINRQTLSAFSLAKRIRTNLPFTDLFTLMLYLDFKVKAAKIYFSSAFDTLSYKTFEFV